MKVLAVLALIAIGGVPTPVAAQRLDAVRLPPRLVLPFRSSLTAPADVPPNLPSPAEYRRTHWKEGAIVGGLLLGLGGAALAHGLCTQSDTRREDCGGKALEGFVFGGATGFAIGALLGGLFPKHSLPPSSAAAVSLGVRPRHS